MAEEAADHTGCGVVYGNGDVADRAVFHIAALLRAAREPADAHSRAAVRRHGTADGMAVFNVAAFAAADHDADALTRSPHAVAVQHDVRPRGAALHQYRSADRAGEAAGERGSGDFVVPRKHDGFDADVGAFRRVGIADHRAGSGAAVYFRVHDGEVFNDGSVPRHASEEPSAHTRLRGRDFHIGYAVAAAVECAGKCRLGRRRFIVFFGDGLKVSDGLPVLISRQVQVLCQRKMSVQMAADGLKLFRRLDPPRIFRRTGAAGKFRRTGRTAAAAPRNEYCHSQHQKHRKQTKILTVLHRVSLLHKF